MNRNATYVDWQENHGYTDPHSQCKSASKTSAANRSSTCTSPNCGEMKKKYIITKADFKKHLKK